KLLKIREQKREEYLKLASEAKRDNIKRMLLRIANVQKKIQLNTLKLLRSRRSEGIKISGKSYEMIDHLVKNHEKQNLNDLQSMLLESLREEDEIQSIIKLASKEYQGTVIERLFESLYACGEENKNYLSELYEEFVNENYW
ncbi:MAG: hypothetical protein ACP5UV_06810, partial [Thermoplasmata archaeon]